MLQVAAPNEVVVLMGFDMRIGETRGMLNFCLPASHRSRRLEDKFAQGWQRTRRQPTADRASPPGSRNLGRVPLRGRDPAADPLPARELLALEGRRHRQPRPPGVRSPVDVHVGRSAGSVGRLADDGRRRRRPRRSHRATQRASRRAVNERETPGATRCRRVRRRARGRRRRARRCGRRAAGRRRPSRPNSRGACR